MAVLKSKKLIIPGACQSLPLKGHDKVRCFSLHTRQSIVCVWIGFPAPNLGKGISSGIPWYGVTLELYGDSHVGGAL